MTMLLNLFKQTADRLATINNIYVTDPGDQTTNEILLERAAAAIEAYEPETDSNTDHMMIRIGDERLILPTQQAHSLITLLQSAQRVKETYWHRREIDPSSPKYMLDADPHPVLEMQLLPNGHVAEFESYEQASRAYEEHKKGSMRLIGSSSEAEAA